MMRRFVWLLICCWFGAVVFSGVQLWKWGRQNYERPTTCVVRAKYPSERAGKYTTYPKFILVLETLDRGYVFDTSVTASAFYQAEVGRNLSLTMRPSEVGELSQQTGNDLTLLFMVLLLVVPFLSLFYVIYQTHRT